MKKKSYWQSIRSILLFPAAAAINIFADKSLPVHMRPDSTLGHRRPSVIANGHAIGDLDHAHDLRRVHRKGFISDARTHFGRAEQHDMKTPTTTMTTVEAMMCANHGLPP